MDMSGVFEEIALEGLDGITLDALWLRLKNRPAYPFKSTDEHVKKYVWKHLCLSTEIEFFQLENPRPELFIIDYDSLVQENRCCITDDVPPDIYSFKIVDKNGLLGCCDTFESRVSVTRDIRSEDGITLMTVEQALERWGQKLTIVASQKLRFQALFLTNFLPTGISAEAYGVAERVGRSRYVGEPTNIHGRPGIANNTMGSSNLFGIIKHLCGRGYFVKQPFNVRLETSGKLYHSRLVHLRHFYRRSCANTGAYYRSVCDFLQGLPGMMAPVETVIQEFGLRLRCLTKHLGPARTPFATDLLPYRSVYPDASKEESERNGQEKMVKVLKLVEPYKIEDRNYEEDKDVEEREEMDEYLDESHKKGSSERLTGQYLYDRSIPSTIIHMIAQSGTNGMSEAQIRQRLHTPFKMVENSVKSLLKAGAVFKFTKQIGTVRIQKYMIPEAAKIYKQIQLGKTEEEGDTDDLNASQNSNPSQGTSLGGAFEADVDFKEEKEDTTSIDATIQSLNMSWIIEKFDSPKPREEFSVTMKKKERSDFILKRLVNHRVCRDTVALYKEMLEWEKSLGWKERMCRKSYKRILKDLYEEGKICHVRVTYGSVSKTKRKRVLFLGHGKLKSDELALKKAAVQHYAYRIKYQTVKAKPETDGPGILAQPVSVCDMLQKAAGTYRDKPSTPKMRKMPREDGVTIGKMEKAQTLHEFMFYLLYDYKGDPNAAGTLEIDEERKEPPVYLDVKDWRRYLPPLKIHNFAMATDMIPGSCMIGDLLMSMPICIFWKLNFLTHEVEGLKVILEDEYKKLYPLNWVPSEVLGRVLQSRAYLQKLNNLLRLLCHIGLLSYGPRPKMPKLCLEYFIVFLHKKAMVLNTSTSLPSRNMTMCPEGQEFPKIHFQFDSMEKVQTYWHEIYLIALSSNLEGKSFGPEKPVRRDVVEKVNLWDVSKPREFSEIKEDDWLPGDRRGACGFDSCLFVHNERGWSSLLRKEPLMLRKRLTVGHKLPSRGKHSEGQSERKVKRIHFEKPKRTMAALKKETKKLKRKRRLSVATSGPRKKCVKKLRALDDEDKQAMREMERLRSQFSPLENGIILICHVAFKIMDPDSLPHFLPLRDVRLSIREFLPDVFKDKTQYSFRGRFLRHALDKNFIKHMAVYLAKARYDQELMSKYMNIGGNLSDPELLAKYIELIKALYNKFSSPDDLLQFPWPSTTAELHSKYTQVKTAEMCEQKKRSANFDSQKDRDIQSLSIWNLLLGWIHDPNEVSNREMYYFFCQYPPEVISHARDLLKYADVMRKAKRSEQTVESSEINVLQQGGGVNHNMVLTIGHKLTVNSKYPKDVFKNTLNQVEVLEDAFWLNKQTTPSSLDALNGRLRIDDTFQTDPQPASQDDRPTSQTSTQGQTQDIRHSQEEIYEELDWRSYQGGCSMAVMFLFALDMVNCKIFIPDDMVRVSEEGKTKLRFKEGKRSAEDMEESANESNDDDLRPPLKRMRKSINIQQTSESLRKQAEALQASSSLSSLSNEGERMSCSGRDVLKQVKEGTTVISMNPLKVAPFTALTSHRVTIASGSLLNLARTSVIDRLDLANSSLTFKRLFVVEPLKMEFALRGEAEIKPARKEDEGNEEECEMDCERGSKDYPDESHSDSSKTELGQTNVEAETFLRSNVESLPCAQAKQSDKSRTRNSCFTKKLKTDFSKIITRLEQVYPLDFDQTDAIQEMRSRLPDQLVEMGEKLYQLVDSYGFPGITELDIEQSQGVPYSSLKTLIKCLCDMNAILKVGSKERRFVGRRHLEKWTMVTQPRLSDKDSNEQSSSSTTKYRIVARPWLTLHGNLNVIYLEHALHSVLTFLYQHPGLHVEGIANKFDPHILSANVYELLDILEELGCIEVTFISKSSKLSVFGPNPRSDPGWLSSSHRVVDINMTSSIQLALFLRALKQHCPANEHSDC